MGRKKPTNPVAKFAHRFNRSKVIDDKTDYQRKPKHKKDFKHAHDDDQK
jgi:hypothetical protein